MNDADNKRIDWIDIAKGIGILLVILGHSVKFGEIVHNLIFSFHMPLFFVLSGAVYKHSDNKTFIIKKINTLIIPFVSFYIIGLIISLIIPEWRSGLSIKGIFKDIYLATPNVSNVSSIWFLACMFIVVVNFNLMQKFNIKVQYFIIAICLVIGLIYPNIIAKLTYLPDGRLPFNIEVSFVAIFFFAMGVWMKKYIINQKIFVNSCIMFCIAFLLNGRVNLHGITYNNPILYIIESLCGTIILIYLCYICSNNLQNKNVLEPIKWLGRHSLIILGIQAIAVRLYVLIINAIDNAEYALYGLPKVHQIISFVSVTLVSVVICLLYDFIKVKARRINE